MSNPPSPWPTVAKARTLFRQLAGLTPAAAHELPVEKLARWLIHHEMGPMAFYRFKSVWPALADELRHDGLAATAENRIHLTALERALSALSGAAIPTVVFKGAATLHYYEAPGLRTMSDVDFWIPREQSDVAIRTLLDAGFQPQFPDKPAELSRSGKLKLIHPTLPASGLELHALPYTGQWLLTAANIQQEAIWQRRQPLQIGHCRASQPEATDLFLHAAIHLSVNHQFDRSTFRGLLDLATLSRNHPPDWSALIDRAQAWDMATALWLPLTLLQHLYSLALLGPILAELAPAAWRQRLFNQWLSPSMLLAGSQLDNTLKRRLYLLLLSDRPERTIRLLKPA